MVIGVTSAHDVKEFMEKRVRSRFSYRKFVLAKPAAGPASAGDSAAAVLADMLALPEGGGDAGASSSHGSSGGGFADEWYARKFNKAVRDAMANAAVKVRGMLAGGSCG